ncbi:MAG: Gfo/Idh/MocA family oxidoreductase [Planctomycetota bacterium]|nr:Gfo/Idh/MocA family oxidoreductase [Planctomycetota bacterium]
MHVPQPALSVSRRQLLKAGSATGLALALPYGATRSNEHGKLKLAFIGVGGRGKANLSTMTQDPGVEVVALCDVDRRYLTSASELFPSARTYSDFRKIYEEAKDIDGVVISIAEHTHAYAVVPALKLGKHVYCEKPLTHNVAEARLITDLASKAGVATQMGTQMHASENYHRVVELIQSHAIGDVTEVHVWVARAWGLQSKEDSITNKDRVFVTERPTEQMVPPDYLDWDLWLGPAAARPYHSVYFPGPNWYRWWDFGNGTMSDLGSHWNDLPYWALKLDAPLSIEGIGDLPHPEIAPASMTAIYEYGARGNLPPCRLTWYQGNHKPRLLSEGKIPSFPSGVLFVGDKGMLLADYKKHILMPEENFKDFQPPAPFIPDSPGQHEEWLAACRTGSPTSSPFSYAGPLTEANHLGNVAFRAGGKILWDSKAMRITNNDEANRFLSRTPRDGWTLN